MPIWQLDERIIFPPPELSEDDGLIAVGGDLSKNRLLLAYSSGIFPWFIYNEEVYWFSPDPRCVLYPAELKVSKSMQKLIKKAKFQITIDRQFEQVINNCASINRKSGNETWIDQHFIDAYTKLFREGIAHSIEVMENNKLVGGLYGVHLGNCFFGESMFSIANNASKCAFIFLAQYFNFNIIDCQVYSEHLASLGAKNITRDKFLLELEKSLVINSDPSRWKID
jgi:leucyl/phenylalanyl-tRNA--protein transferase